MRTPLVVIAVLGVLLLGIDLAFGEGGDGSPGAREPATAPVATIARRVEGLRDLRYRRIPVPQRVTGAQARRDGLKDYDASEPPAARVADEEVLELLGLIPRGTSLRHVAASLYGQGVAGYYDPRTKRLKVVSGAATSTRALAETVIAHELTHALEDQHYGLDDEGPSEGDDRALARLALVEGTATEVMTRYGERFIGRGELLASAIGSAFAPTGDLPPYIEAQTVFPYLAGQQFVQELLRRAGGRWALVDDAERVRPPVSTEQVLHPERYLRADEPKPVRAAGRDGVRLRMVARAFRHLGRVRDARAARRRRRGWGGGGRRGLGRRPLGAVALAPTAGQRLHGALPRGRRARPALALGHPARPARVRGAPGGLEALGPRRARRRTGDGDGPPRRHAGARARRRARAPRRARELGRPVALYPGISAGGGGIGRGRGTARSGAGSGRLRGCSRPPPSPARGRGVFPACFATAGSPSRAAADGRAARAGASLAARAGSSVVRAADS